MQRRERKMATAYYKEVESLRKEHKQTEQHIDMLMDDKVADLNSLSTNIKIAQSNALVEEIRNLKLPLPPHSDKTPGLISLTLICLRLKDMPTCEQGSDRKERSAGKQ